MMSDHDTITTSTKRMMTQVLPALLERCFGNGFQVVAFVISALMIRQDGASEGISNIAPYNGFSSFFMVGCLLCPLLGVS